MRKVRLLSVLILLVILISACGGQNTLPDEPYSPVEYSLYPCPEGAYVGDTMPYVTEDGTLELYYLYDTDHNGQGWHGTELRSYVGSGSRNRNRVCPPR